MKQVLVVDDEVVLAQIIAEILQDEGYEVLVANGSRSLFRLLETERPDLILLDVMMPDGDGREAATALQANPDLRSIPLLVMSAAATAQSLTVPIAGFVRKPFELDDLLTRVRAIIGPPRGLDLGSKPG